MNLTTLHADVAGVVDREAQGLTHIFLERMAPIVAVDAHDAHARVYDLDTGLPAENLRPGAWDMALAVIEIEVLGRFPGEIARSCSQSQDRQSAWPRRAACAACKRRRADRITLVICCSA